MLNATVTDFLRRYPWSDRQFLSDLYGARSLASIVQSLGPWTEQRIGSPWGIDLSGLDVATCATIRVVKNVPEVGECYASTDEPAASAFALHRFQVARTFALKVFGPASILGGLSPSPVADMEFPADDRWYRIWVDLAETPLEAIGAFRSLPEAYGPGVVDVILTADESRFDAIHSQVFSRWPGNEDVFIFHYRSKAWRVVRHKNQLGDRWRPYTVEGIEAHFHRRVLGIHGLGIRYNDNSLSQFTRRQAVGQAEDNLPSKPAFIRTSSDRYAFQLTALEWDALFVMGHNPFLTAWELAYLLAVRELSQAREFRKQRVAEKLAFKLKAIKRLYQMNLISFSGGRVVMARHAFYAIAHRLGLGYEEMVVKLGWPLDLLERSSRNHKYVWMEYATDWFRRLKRHQTLCRQFCLAVVFGGRSVANGWGWPEMQILSMIGGRLSYRAQIDPQADFNVKLVISDGLIAMSIVDNASGQPDVKLDKLLFIEIDRATNRGDRIDHRLDVFERAFSYFRLELPTIVWIVDGPPSREKLIIEKARARGLDSWTVTLDRLVLAADDPWWTLNPPAYGELEMNSSGCMSPYRRIWHSSKSDQLDLPFLGVDPWQAGFRVYKAETSFNRGVADRK